MTRQRRPAARPASPISRRPRRKPEEPRVSPSAVVARCACGGTMQPSNEDMPTLQRVLGNQVVQRMLASRSPGIQPRPAAQHVGGPADRPARGPSASIQRVIYVNNKKRTPSSITNLQGYQNLSPRAQHIVDDWLKNETPRRDYDKVPEIWEEAEEEADKEEKLEQANKIHAEINQEIFPSGAGYQDLKIQIKGHTLLPARYQGKKLVKPQQEDIDINPGTYIHIKIVQYVDKGPVYHEIRSLDSGENYRISEDDAKDGNLWQPSTFQVPEMGLIELPTSLTNRVGQGGKQEAKAKYTPATKKVGEGYQRPTGFESIDKNDIKDTDVQNFVKIGKESITYPRVPLILERKGNNQIMTFLNEAFVDGKVAIPQTGTHCEYCLRWGGPNMFDSDHVETWTSIGTWLDQQCVEMNKKSGYATLLERNFNQAHMKFSDYFRKLGNSNAWEVTQNGVEYLFNNVKNLVLACKTCNQDQRNDEEITKFLGQHPYFGQEFLDWSEKKAPNKGGIVRKGGIYTSDLVKEWNRTQQHTQKAIEYNKNLFEEQSERERDIKHATTEMRKGNTDESEKIFQIEQTRHRVSKVVKSVALNKLKPKQKLDEQKLTKSFEQTTSFIIEEDEFFDPYEVKKKQQDLEEKNKQIKIELDETSEQVKKRKRQFYDEMDRSDRYREERNRYQDDSEFYREESEYYKERSRQYREDCEYYRRRNKQLERKNLLQDQEIMRLKERVAQLEKQEDESFDTPMTTKTTQQSPFIYHQTPQFNFTSNQTQPQFNSYQTPQFNFTSNQTQPQFNSYQMPQFNFTSNQTQPQFNPFQTQQQFNPFQTQPKTTVTTSNNNQWYFTRPSNQSQHNLTQQNPYQQTNTQNTLTSRIWAALTQKDDLNEIQVERIYQRLLKLINESTLSAEEALDLVLNNDGFTLLMNV